MKKRIMSLILAIAMILAMVPESALASSTTGGALMYRYADWTTNSGIPTENISNPLSDTYNGTVDTYDSVFFYYVENNQETRLSWNQLESADTSIVSISEDIISDTAVRLKMSATGTTKITYTDSNNNEYSVDISITTPTIPTGFVCEPVMGNPTGMLFKSIGNSVGTTDSYKFYYTNASGTTPITVDKLRVANTAIASLATDTTNTGAVIVSYDTVGTTSIVYTDGNNTEHYINLMSSPVLCCSPTNNPTEGPFPSIWNPAGTSASYNFYYIDATGKHSVTASQLNVLNSSIASIAADTANNNAVLVSFINAGSTSITYTVGNDTYSVNVMVDGSTNPPMPTSSLMCSPVGDTSEALFGGIGMPAGDAVSYYFYFVDPSGTKALVDIANLTVANPTIASIVADSNGAVRVSFNNEGETKIIYTKDGVEYFVNVMVDGSSNLPPSSGTTPTPGLVFYWLQQDANANFYEDANGNYMPDTRVPEGLAGDGEFEIYAVHVSPGYFFFRDENGTETQLSFSDVTITTGSLKLEEKKGATIINAMSSKVGDTAVISYTNGTTVYTFDVEVVKPPRPITGFYLETDMGEFSYNSLTITDTENVFYLNVSSGWEVQSVTLDQSLAAIANYEIAQDGSYIKITVTGDPQDMNYGLSYVVVDSENANVVCQMNDSIHLANGRAALMIGFGTWDNNSYVENPNNVMSGHYTCSPGKSNDAFFYFVENGNPTRVPMSSLTSANTNIVALAQSPINPNAIRMNPLAFGNTKINYTHTDGKVYSVDVYVELPMIGFYNGKIVSQNSYISEFTLTSSEDTFYLLPKDSGHTFTSVTLNADFAQIATATISDDNSYVTVKVTGTPANGRNYGISYVTATTNNGNTQTWNGSTFIMLKDGRASLKMSFGSWDDNGNYTENPNNVKVNTYTGSPGSRNEMFFYYFTENGTETRLSWDQLSVSNTDILTISQGTGNPNAVCINPLVFGSTKINYTHTDGKTYSVDVAVDLPMYGYYISQTAAQSTYIQNFKVTETENTFYLSATGGWTFENVMLVDGFDEIATYTVSPDKTYVAIKVNEAPEDGRWYRVSFDRVNASGMKDGSDRVGIQLFSGMPGLRYQWPDFLGGTNNHSPMYSYLNTAKGYMTDVWVYYFDGTNYNKLTAQDLYCTNSVMEFVQAEGTPDMVTFMTKDWGSSRICYDAAGNTYYIDVDSDLQDFGFYKEKTISKANWFVGTFTVTDTVKTYYLMSQNGRVMNDAKLVGTAASDAMMEVSSDKTCITITITGNPQPGTYLSVDFTSPDSMGEVYTCSYGVNIENEMCQHTMTEMVGVKAASCTEDGYTGDLVCVECNKVLDIGMVLLAGHNYIDGVCAVCQDELEKDNVEEVTPVVKQEAVESTRQEMAPVVSTISDAIQAAINNAGNVETVKEEVKETLKVELQNAVAEETIDKMVEAVAAGKDIVTEIVSNIIKEESVKETIKEKVEEVLTTAQNVAQYLDIEIKIKAVETDVTGAVTEEELGTMNELENAISFSVVIPTELEKAGRTFFVLRIHNGVVDTLPVTANSDGTYSFSTDQFSTYVLAYEDEVKVPANTPSYAPDNTPDEESESKPSTGVIHVAKNDKNTSEKEVSNEEIEVATETEDVETEVSAEEMTEEVLEEITPEDNTPEETPAKAGNGKALLFIGMIVVALGVLVIARKKFKA